MGRPRFSAACRVSAPDLAHEVGEVVPVFPLLAQGQRDRTTGKVDLDSVEIVVFNHLAKNAQLVVADFLVAKVPENLAVRGPGSGQQPLRMALLHRNCASHHQIVVRAVDPVGVEGLQPPLPGRLQKDPHDVDALLHPLPVALLVVQRHHLAGIGGLVAFAPVPPDAVDLALRIVGKGKAQLHQVTGRDIGKFEIAVDGVEIDHHPPAPLDLGQVLGGQYESFAVINRGLLGRPASRRTKKGRQYHRGQDTSRSHSGVSVHGKTPGGGRVAGRNLSNSAPRLKEMDRPSHLGAPESLGR